MTMRVALTTLIVLACLWLLGHMFAEFMTPY